MSQWTKQETELLKCSFPDSTKKELIELFPHKSWPSIHGKAQRMDLRKSELGRQKAFGMWTEEEDKILKEHYETSFTTELLSMIPNRKKEAIVNRAIRLGLSKDISFRQKSSKVEKECMQCNRKIMVYPSEIKKGSGKHCSKECYNLTRKEKRGYVICKHCGEEFHITHSRHTRKYCSAKCRSQASVTRIKKNCDYCDKEFNVTPNVEKKGAGKFCSRECGSKGGIKPKGIYEKTGKVEKICQGCKSTFLVYPYVHNNGGGKFCSRECMKKRIQKDCIQCGITFETFEILVEKGRGKFCSKKCLHENNRAEKVKKECIICDKTYLIMPSAEKKGAGKFCSRECRGKGRVTSLERNCLLCGSVFTVTQHVLKKGAGKFCSRDCHDKEVKSRRVNKNCANCGKEYSVIKSATGGSKGKYCSKKCLKASYPPQVACICKWCNEMFFVIPAKFRYENRRAGQFCSRSCQGSYLVSSMHGKRSSIEFDIEEEIKKLNLNYQVQAIIGPWNVDFYLPEFDLVIECDGEYFHGPDFPKTQARDRKKNGWMKKHHYNLIRIKEEDIKVDPQKALMDKLLPYLTLI